MAPILADLMPGALNCFYRTATENGSFEIYLVPKEYNVRVYHKVDPDNYYVSINTFNFTESQTIELNVTLGVKVEGGVKYAGNDVEDIIITFTNNGTMTIKSRSLGEIRELFLPPNRTYEIVVNQTEGADDSTWYRFEDTLEVNDTEISNLIINLAKYYKVTGTAYIDWNHNIWILCKGRP